MRLIDANALMDYTRNQKSRTIDCNDIARFPTAFDKEKVIDEVIDEVIDDVFELLKSKRDSRYMKIPFDDLEIRKYKNELKRGGVSEDRT